MRLLLPLLFVAVILYWLGQILWFIFVVHFVGVVVTVSIFVIVFFSVWLSVKFANRHKSHE